MRGRKGAALLLLGLLALSGCGRPGLAPGRYATADRRWQLEVDARQGEGELVLTLPSGREERFAVEGDRLILQRGG